MPASVVISRPAIGGRILQGRAHDLGRIDDALLEHVAVLVVLGVVAERLAARLEHLADHDRALDAGVLGDLADRSLQRRLTMLMPASWSSLSPLTVIALAAFSSTTPPPDTTPSSTAARVALSASSTRSLRSFTSTSVAPPTLITATPPASLARRSCSFSRS